MLREQSMRDEGEIVQEWSDMKGLENSGRMRGREGKRCEKAAIPFQWHCAVLSL